MPRGGTLMSICSYCEEAQATTSISIPTSETILLGYDSGGTKQVCVECHDLIEKRRIENRAAEPY